MVNILQKLHTISNSFPARYANIEKSFVSNTEMIGTIVLRMLSRLRSSGVLIKYVQRT